MLPPSHHNSMKWSLAFEKLMSLPSWIKRPAVILWSGHREQTSGIHYWRSIEVKSGVKMDPLTMHSVSVRDFRQQTKGRRTQRESHIYRTEGIHTINTDQGANDVAINGPMLPCRCIPMILSLCACEKGNKSAISLRCQAVRFCLYSSLSSPVQLWEGYILYSSFERKNEGEEWA